MEDAFGGFSSGWLSPAALDFGEMALDDGSLG